MSGPAITYAARPDATPEAEVSTLVNVYKFVLTKKEAALERPDDARVRNAEEVNNVSQQPATPNIIHQ